MSDLDVYLVLLITLRPRSHLTVAIDCCPVTVKIRARAAIRSRGSSHFGQTDRLDRCDGYRSVVKLWHSLLVETTLSGAVGPNLIKKSALPTFVDVSCEWIMEIGNTY